MAFLKETDHEKIRNQVALDQEEIQSIKTLFFPHSINHSKDPQVLSSPIQTLKMTGKWNSLSKEERISIRKQFQEIRFENKIKEMRKQSKEKKGFKNPIKELKMSGKWDSLSKEERISIRKQFQAMKQLSNRPDSSN